MMLKKPDVSEEYMQSQVASLAERLSLQSIDDACYFPKFVQIETIRHCNARCPFCPVDTWDMSQPLMKDALFEKIIDELSGYTDWIENVNISRSGEPLLDKKIASRIKRAKDAGLKFVMIQTNGSLLDEKKATAILEAGIDQVYISMDSIDQETYEKMRVRLDYDTVVANIKNFFRLRNEIRPSTMIRVRSICPYPSEPEFREAMRRWLAFWEPHTGPNDRLQFKPLHNWGNNKSWDAASPDSDTVYDPCISVWSTLNVTAMGTVALCCQDTDAKVLLGDVNTQSLADVWRGHEFQAVRDKHSSGNRNDINFCIGCRSFDPEHSTIELDN